MKKKMILLAVVGLAILQIQAREKMLITGKLTGNFSPDQSYENIYGAFHLGFDLTAAWNFYNHFNVWTGVGVTPAFATIPDFQDSAFSWQLFLQLGLGYRFRLRKSLYLNLHAGAARVIFGERAMGISTHDSAWGFEGGIDFHLLLKRKWFLAIGGDYVYAQMQLGQKQLQPGGVRLEAGVGRSF